MSDHQITLRKIEAQVAECPICDWATRILPADHPKTDLVRWVLDHICDEHESPKAQLKSAGWYNDGRGRWSRESISAMSTFEEAWQYEFPGEEIPNQWARPDFGGEAAKIVLDGDYREAT